MISDRLLNLFAHEPRLCPYFDIPLHTPTTTCSRRCGGHPVRRASATLFREYAPRSGAAIRTVFILGFPGETERRFETLLNFVNEIRFDKIGVFPSRPKKERALFQCAPARNATAARRCESS